MAPRGRPCLPRGQGWVWQRLPRTRASGSGGEGKETRTRGSAGDDAAFERHGGHCHLRYTVQPGRKISLTIGVPRDGFPPRPRCPPAESLISAQPAEGGSSGEVGCGGRWVPVPVPRERGACRRQRCAPAAGAASPAPLTAPALSDGLEPAPGQLASGRAAGGPAAAAEEPWVPRGQGQLGKMSLLLGFPLSGRVPGPLALGPRAGWDLAVEALVVGKIVVIF